MFGLQQRCITCRLARRLAPLHAREVLISRCSVVAHMRDWLVIAAEESSVCACRTRPCAAVAGLQGKRRLRLAEVTRPSACATTAAAVPNPYQEGKYDEPWKPYPNWHPCYMGGAMEKLYGSSKARAIGGSNCSCKKLEDLFAVARVPPAVNQVECHLVWQQDKLCQSKGCSSFCKLGII
jgi:hypothetical protein